MTKDQAGGEEYKYPRAGDEAPRVGAKVQLLTLGGVHVSGPWLDDGSYLGWLPLPRRNQEKEDTIAHLNPPQPTAVLQNQGETEMMPYTNRELVLMVDNKPDATELERELAQRLDEVTVEVGLLQSNGGVSPYRIDRWERTV